MSRKIFSLPLMLIFMVSAISCISGQDSKAIPEYIINVDIVRDRNTGLVRTKLNWRRNKDVSPDYKGSYIYVNDTDLILDNFDDHYENKKYSISLIHQFSDKKRVSDINPKIKLGSPQDLWLNLAIEKNLVKKGNIEKESNYPSASLGFPYDVDLGQTLVEALEAYTEMSTEFKVQYNILIKKLNNNSDNYVQVVGSASNVFFGINCQHYETDTSICNLLQRHPKHKLGLLDCDKGGEDNATECANGRNPILKSDDDQNAVNPQEAELRAYNEALAIKRSEIGVEFLNRMYSEEFGAEFSAIQTASIVVDRSFNRPDDKFNFNQSVLFNFYIFE